MENQPQNNLFREVHRKVREVKDRARKVQDEEAARRPLIPFFLLAIVTPRRQALEAFRAYSTDFWLIFPAEVSYRQWKQGRLDLAKLLPHDLGARPHHPRVLGGSALRRSDQCIFSIITARSVRASDRCKAAQEDAMQTREDKLRDEESLFSAA